MVTLGCELAVLKTCKGTKAHSHDSGSLKLAKAKALHKGLTGILRGTLCADKVYNLVDIVLRDEQTQNKVQTILRNLKVVLCTANNYLVAVIYEVSDKLLEVKKLWSAIYKGDIIYRK